MSYTLTDLKNSWVNSRDINEGINVDFTSYVNRDPELKAHRDWVESHIFGFGERSFHWLHKIVVDEMPQSFSFLEIGGFRMQVVSLYELLAKRTNRHVDRYCVSPMDSTNKGFSPHWESDYAKDSVTIHEAFDLKHDYKLFHGLSTNVSIQVEATLASPYDVVYIDGGHDAETVRSDMKIFARLVKPGGYLICDDCSNGLKLWPGAFPGIISVSIEVDNYMDANASEWEHIGAVMHNRIWRKK